MQYGRAEPERVRRMDRLSAVMRALPLALVLLVGCGEPPAPAQSTRFESASSVSGDIDQVLHGQCDVAHPAASAPAFTYPETTTPVASASGKWTWVNLWATWCRPCVEEIPMLRAELANSSVELRFVSADSADEELTRFRSEHAFTDASPRLRDPASIASALAAVGYRGASSLPVHVLLDPEGKARCVRAGAVEARHVRAVLGAIGQGRRAPRIR